MFEEVLIITPFYNSYSAFERTFKSVVEQTHKRFEWIIVDDCSDNGQFTKLRNLVSQEKRIKLVRNKKNLGAGPSRNLGLSFFNHKYLTFIDSDDEWHKNFMNRKDEITKLMGEKFQRIYRIYLWGCAQAFLQDLQVMQLTLAKKIDTVPLTKKY